VKARNRSCTRHRCFSEGSRSDTNYVRPLIVKHGLHWPHDWDICYSWYFKHEARHLAIEYYYIHWKYWAHVRCDIFWVVQTEPRHLIVQRIFELNSTEIIFVLKCFIVKFKARSVKKTVSKYLSTKCCNPISRLVLLTNKVSLDKVQSDQTVHVKCNPISRLVLLTNKVSLNKVHSQTKLCMWSVTLFQDWFY
jgi:hypothetical protein